MRLTKLLKEKSLFTNKPLYDGVDCSLNDVLFKLGQLEDIEDELCIDLITLFDSKYTSTIYEMELCKDGETIFFNGEHFDGYYSAEDFLKLIKDMLSMYKQIIKHGR